MLYGIPGPSRVGSQEQPIVISSDEGVKVKVELEVSEKSISDGREDTKRKKAGGVEDRKKASGKKDVKRKKAGGKNVTRKNISNNGTTEAISDKAKGKCPVQSSGSSTNSSSSESEGSSDLPLYLRRDDMPKELDEALRVNKDINY